MYYRNANCAVSDLRRRRSSEIKLLPFIYLLKLYSALLFDPFLYQVVVYDITQPSTLEKAKQWIRELQRQADPNIVIALAGNKLDLAEGRRGVEEEVSRINCGLYVLLGLVGEGMAREEGEQAEKLDPTILFRLSSSSIFEIEDGL